MELPLDLHFRGVERTPAILRKIQAQAARLDRIARGLISCRVAVERPQTHQRSGRSFRVRIEASIPPEHRLVVRREPSQGEMHTSLHAVIGDAFRALERQLKEVVRTRRGDVKHHPPSSPQAAAAAAKRARRSSPPPS